MTLSLRTQRALRMLGAVAGLAAFAALTAQNNGDHNHTLTAFSSMLPIAVASLVLSTSWSALFAATSQATVSLSSSIGGASAALRMGACPCLAAADEQRWSSVAGRTTPAGTVTFLLVSTIAPVSVWLTTTLLMGAPFAALRVLSIAVIVVVAVVVVVVRGRRTTSLPIVDERTGSFSQRFLRAWLSSLSHQLAWWLLGLWAAIILAPLVAATSPSTLVWFPVLVVPLVLCPLSAAPIAWSLAQNGASMGTTLAVVVAAPLLSVSMLALLRQRRGGRFTALLALVAVAVAVAAGCAMTAFGGKPPELVMPMPTSAAAVVVVALVLAALWDCGPRGLIQQLLHPFLRVKAPARAKGVMSRSW
jgi:uncharacterized membrane protein YraQ (UPF0718 family)